MSTASIKKPRRTCADMGKIEYFLRFCLTFCLAVAIPIAAFIGCFVSAWALNAGLKFLSFGHI